jgi:hypothetical protein
MLSVIERNLRNLILAYVFPITILQGILMATAETPDRGVVIPQLASFEKSNHIDFSLNGNDDGEADACDEKLKRQATGNAVFNVLLAGLLTIRVCGNTVKLGMSLLDFFARTGDDAGDSIAWSVVAVDVMEGFFGIYQLAMIITLMLRWAFWKAPRPWLLIVAVRDLAGFSGLKFFAWAKPMYILQQLNVLGLKPSMPSWGMSIGVSTLALISMFLIFELGLFVLHIKMQSFLIFAAAWNVWNCIDFIFFANQMISISDTDKLSVYRVLLFLFGRSDTDNHFQAAEIKLAANYMEVLLLRLWQLKDVSCWRRTAALMTFGANNLQQVVVQPADDDSKDDIRSVGTRGSLETAFTSAAMI